ncbi:hypothetical protein C461_05297 [Halorubrum aidingense JCM 13560]|uniref:Uncharacterized protein n=1 Tax=Halorubrum aidingense JCM 13560 TaxID=1230454 RepID=M0PJX3_9EURY|nr:hypothetical protein C461_05297 [Halorubrum aidingense JCM 13560]
MISYHLMISSETIVHRMKLLHSFSKTYSSKYSILVKRFPLLVMRRGTLCEFTSGLILPGLQMHDSLQRQETSASSTLS